MGEERLPAKRNRFGIKKPPLYVTIKTFLDRYPDGQIFKELIQNADDAGAKVVKFYLDPRQHGTKDLIDPAMADFQGPALLVYNDAPFTEEDWDGIQKPQCSNKAEDPMKVGKFGIGFNSVYHVTDLPTIISGKMKMIGYLDPQEKIWEGESGISYPFSEVCRYKDTIAPYQKICNFSNSFHGTLFQFPLRTKESKLSDKSHNISTLQKLLDALKKEADCLLLFLRSVFMIEIIELPAVEKALFGISIVCNDDRQLINSVTTALKDQKVQTSTRECSVTVTTACSTSEYQWCVVDQVGSEDPEVLKAANNLHLLPWVGVAYKGKKDPTGSGGRVFCCLPMPNEVLSPLPVHVNGTFGLTDDRRTLKWKTSERQNDAVSQWNEMIINKLLPSCYAQLIHQCIHRGLSASDVYSAWPDVGLVGKDTNWSPLLKSFFEYLLKMNVLWTDCESASGSCGKWVNLNSAIVTVVSTESTTMSTIKKLMCNCDTNLVEVPKHVLIGLEYSKYELRELSPDLVRQMVKTNSANMKRDEKLHLLTYCLSDRDYSKIVGLALLPLLNGTFATFTANTFQSKVFLCTKDYPSFLFKPFNVANDLLVDDGHEVELCDLAMSGVTQLSLLDDTKVAQILQKCLSAPSGLHLSQNSLPLDWLKSFWEWSISHKLDEFVGLFLVPLSHPQGCISRMVGLNTSTVMQIECDDNEKLLACMKKLPLQLTLLEEYPYARQNSLFQFMHRMTAAGLLQALTNVDRTALKHVQLNTDEAFTIQSFLASVATITTYQEETLSELCILITSRRTVFSAQIARQNSWKGQIIVLPDEFAGKPYPAGLIVLSNTWNQIQFLQQLLPNFVRFPTATELISEILLPMIADRTAFSNECGVIMKHIFDIVTDIEKYSPIISKLSFIQVNSISELKAPCELYCPKEMQELFYKQPVFPLPPFDQPLYLDKLIICGLKCTVTTKDIEEIIEEIKAPYSLSPQLVDEIRITRSCAVLKYIQNNNLQQMLKSFTAYNIIPIEHFPPAGYPQCLVWKGSKFESHLISLSEHVVLEKSDVTSLIAGSQVYMVRNDCEFSPEKLNQSSAIRAKHVLAHFKEVIEHFKDISDDILHRIIHHTYKFLMDNISKCDDDLHEFSHPWIWVGKKFVYPQVAAMKQNHQFRYNFDPYHYTIPDEFCKYDKLFSRFDVPLETTNHQLVAVLAAIKEECVFNDEEALSMVLGILNYLTKNGERSIDLPNETIYVPIESSPLKLESSKDVVYSDNHCLNQYIATYKSGKDYKIIHPAIASNLARCLHINPLSACIASKNYIFQSISQHEPLVTRLKNILGDYKDGLTIIKELLQNADDAGATEVNICYDARTHCKDLKQLFFPHMASCHGPALVVHNNAQFTEADFENITKLGGVTKLHEPLKIGKFGLGFCSVYHITDVPSFISGDLFSIFDPTGQHLSSSEFDPAQPRGQRISLKHPIFEVSRQLDPYIGVFDFDPLTTFDGTIFRFPFRIAPSEISDSVYSKESIERLKSDFIKAGSKLLLFLQNVEVITFSEIHSQDGKFSSIVKLQKMEQCTNTPACKYYGISKVTPQQRDVEHWLVSTHNDKVVHCGTQKYATASVACSLKQHKLEKTYSVKRVDGESFCYLPLSCKTGLPVHISSNFAVINNRRGIWTTDQTTPNQGDSESKWNSELMRTVIPQAYICMLKALKTLFENKKLQSYSFYTLWPIHHNLQQQIPWEICVTGVYEGIGSNGLLYSVFALKWLNVRDSQFLSDSILCMKYESNVSAAGVVNEACKQLKLPIIKLPEAYILELKISLFTEEMFAKRFFVNIDSIDRECKINVLERMFKMYSFSNIDEERWQCIKNHLTSNPSVPCGPDGKRLRKCNEVVDPQASFAQLFYSEEALFPIERFCHDKIIHSALKELGMVSTFLPWTMLEERARRINSLHQKYGRIDLRKIKMVMECAENNISYKKKPDQEMQDRLSYICIFSVKQRPADYPVKWCGTRELQCGRQLIISGDSQIHDFGLIAGSQAGILSSDFKHLSVECLRIFGFHMKPSVSEVLMQLKVLIDCALNKKVPIRNEMISKMSAETYKFFEMHMNNDELPSELLELLKIPCIWSGASFVHPTCFADEWSLSGPFLFQTPSSIATAPKIKKFLQIKRQFSTQDIIHALQEVSDLHKNLPLRHTYHDFLHAAVSELTKCEIPPEADVMMPSHRFVMVKAKDLYYCDDEGWPVDPKCEMINGIVPNILAHKLGVRPVRNKKLEMNSLPFLALPFGQREPLTQRIKNILREYPFDITFLKELLQNADDSKATKMFVILDNRHHGEQKVLSNEWGALQGPALLVWNDKPFTDKDMKGIQELGCGSKRSETEAIGQYGIGFNVVYHITDCPSFITNKSLCVLDPHCRYIPKAEPSHPGGVYKLTKDFLDYFSDLKSAYLYTGLKDKPNFHSGVLFRFPLRHSPELVTKSEIATSSNPLDAQMQEPVTVSKMKKKIDEWAPQIKQSLYFLQNITEIKFLTIDSRQPELFTTLYHYKCNLNDSAMEMRHKICSASSAFTNMNKQPCSFFYPLEIIEFDSSGRELLREQWAIQQGIGDVLNVSQNWAFSGKMKPRHGIAAPLNSSTGCDGQVFCFLPLPISSGLPVHINGQFILDASRRALWASTNPGQQDERTLWNEKILSSISSSYAEFLGKITSCFEKSSHDIDIVKNRVEEYYYLFPTWTDESESQIGCVWLARDVYKKLANQNASIFCRLEATENKINTCWHPIASNELCNQIYFVEEKIIPELKNILVCLGMKITQAPIIIKNHFVNLGIKIPVISPHTVFTHYKECCIDLFQIPCHIKDTAFQSVNVFKQFSQYLLHLNPESHQFQFPKPPFGCPLLLTADNQLRKFDDCRKVLTSKYSHLFQHQHKFLHPEMIELQYTVDYFLTPKECNFDFVNDLIASILNQRLYKVHQLPLSESGFTIGSLSSLWKCISHDPVFKSQLYPIVQNWAILLTTDEELFSYSDDHMVPVVVDTEQMADGTVNVLFSEAVDELKMLGIPILDSTVIEAHVSCCPCTSDHSGVLKNLYNLHSVNDISSKLDEGVANILLNYFRNINFSSSSDDLNSLVELPLCMDITGSFKAPSKCDACYIWPEQLPEAGISKWLNGSNTLFLSKKWKWTIFFSLHLHAKEICVEDVYMKYIFKHFSTLSSTERHTHLEYIRDRVLQGSKSEFQNLLKKLPFIEHDGTLMCVCHFYHPKKAIFGFFPTTFFSLPTSFGTNQWLQFLISLGLKIAPTKEEFLTFCNQTATGEVVNTLQASNHLLECLFEEETWHEDSEFLFKISTIPFVCSDPAAKYTWIAAAYKTPCIQKGGMYISTIQLNGSATTKYQGLLWTVKPTVNIETKDHTSLLNSLHVITSPKIADVVENIKHISASKFADNKLFTNYPSSYQTAKQCKALIEVVAQHFKYLKDHNGFQCCLSELCCIPVHAIPSQPNFDGFVLVKPNRVMLDESASQFHPYLHALPNDLSQFASNLYTVGVAKLLGLNHIRLALELIYENEQLTECSAVPVDPNIITMVQKLVDKLYNLLTQSDKTKTSAEVLKPLYLPSSSGRLLESSQLFYCDCDTYKNLHSSVVGKEITFVRLPEGCQFTDIQFIMLLPNAIRPKPISKYCTEKLHPQSIIADECKVATKIQNVLTSASFRAAVCALVRHETNQETSCQVEALLKLFQDKVKVYEANPLKVKLLSCSSGNEIASINVSIFIETSDVSCVFYIRGMPTTYELHKIYMEIGKRLALVINDKVDVKMNSEYLIERLGILMMAEDAEEMRDYLMRLNIKLDRSVVQQDDNITPSLGARIPRAWLQYLDHSVGNIYRPEEWVAYEMEEDAPIFVRILCPVLDDTHEANQLPKRYVIWISSDDTKEVSYVDLYKFCSPAVYSTQQPDVCCTDIVPAATEEDDQRPRKKLRLDNVKSTKDELSKQLKECWKLSKEEQEKVLRRLKFKWHPDRNSDQADLAEEIFKYLMEQVEHHRRHNETVDDRGATTSSNYQYSSGNFESSDFHSKWRSSSNHSPHNGPSCRFEGMTPRANSTEAKRWLRQAEGDFEALKILFEQVMIRSDICCNVCFMAHEVVEKALKAGRYATSGMSSDNLKNHQMMPHAYAIVSEKPEVAHGLDKLVAPLEPYYLDTRFPNRHSGDTAPKDVFHAQHATDAKEAAAKVLHIIQRVVNSRNN